MKFYVVYLNDRGGGGHIIDTCDTLLEAKEVVSRHPNWTIMMKYEDRPKT